jgi:hypothetical protein
MRLMRLNIYFIRIPRSLCRGAPPSFDSKEEELNRKFLSALQGKEFYFMSSG